MADQPFDLDACLAGPETRLEALKQEAEEWLKTRPVIGPLKWRWDQELGWLLGTPGGLVLGRVWSVDESLSTWAMPWKWEVLCSSMVEGRYSTCNAAKRRVKPVLSILLKLQRHE